MGTVDRTPYLSATTLDQAFLDACQDNLEGRLEMVCDIQTSDGFIRTSDRNKYFGSIFYEALSQFPIIKRTVGDWLAPDIQFSTLAIAISNVDGRFNKYIAGGGSFNGWINKTVRVNVGLRDVMGSFTTIFDGQISDVGGFQRDRLKVTLTARDRLDKLNVKFPKTILLPTAFPDLEDNLAGTVVPVIYGDWTTNLEVGKVNTLGTVTTGMGASIPGFPTNGKAVGVLNGTVALNLVISENNNLSVDASNVFLKRSDVFYPFSAGDITINAGNNTATILQANCGGGTTIDGTPYQFQSGDVFAFRLIGKDLSGYNSNSVAQARDIIITQGLASTGDFDANWNSYRDKATPAESAIVNIPSRVWVQEQEEVIKYARSLLDQVRLEIFVDRSLKLKLNSLHLDDFVASPTFTVKQWDVVSGTFTPILDDKNVWNRAQADYNLNPLIKENSRTTAIFRNQAAINQIAGKLISKKVVFPNLYVESDVVAQLREMIRLSSGYAEFIDVTLTSRAFLRDIGEFVNINVDFGSSKLSNVPAMIREIGYDPAGLKIPVKLWSMQMIPFPGYSPSYVGITGGSTATITQE